MGRRNKAKGLTMEVKTGKEKYIMENNDKR